MGRSVCAAGTPGGRNFVMRHSSDASARVALVRLTRYFLDFAGTGSDLFLGGRWATV